MKVGIIGGTGFYNPGLLEKEKEVKMKTPFGDAVLKTGFYQGMEIFFLPRHGEQHSVPPHLVNYRANIWALREAGAAVVIATAAVGSLNLNMGPGEIVLVDQFLDFTKSRPTTFFEGGEEGVLHVDVTNPYCPDQCQHLKKVADGLGIDVHSKGTYVCTEGPRYETASVKLLLPQPLGPTTTVIPFSNSILTRSAKDLKPWISIHLRYIISKTTPYLGSTINLIAVRSSPSISISTKAGIIIILIPLGAI